MSVYVDNPRNSYGRMKMCHMVANSIDELHEMADDIGINRKWFQSHTKYPHYDICLSKRKKAVELGAIETTTKDIVLILRNMI